jgi:hypothetical protein
MLAGSKLNRSLGEKRQRTVDVVLVRQASAAHAPALELNDANLMAVGQHGRGASPSKPLPFRDGELSPQPSVPIPRHSAAILTLPFCLIPRAPLEKESI